MEAGKLKTPFPSLSCRLFYVGIRFWQWDGFFGNQRRQRSSSCCFCRFLSSLILGTGFFCSSFPGSEHKHQEAREVVAGMGAAASWSLDYSHDRVFLTVTVTIEAFWLCTHPTAANVATIFSFGHCWGFFWESFLQLRLWNTLFLQVLIKIFFFHGWMQVSWELKHIYKSGDPYLGKKYKSINAKLNMKVNYIEWEKIANYKF